MGLPGAPAGAVVPGLSLAGFPGGPLRLAEAPIPNSSVQLLLGLMSVVMPAAVAARVFLLALVAASVVLALALGRRCQPRAPGAFAALLLVAIYFNAAFFNGYTNFQVGMLLLGAWFLLPEARRDQVLPIMGFGLALFFTHAMVFIAFGALVGLQALATRRLHAAVLGLMPSAALAAWYVLADAGGGATEPNGSGGLAGFLAYKAYTFAKLGPYQNFVFAGGGDLAARPAVYWAGAAINAAFALGLAAAILLGLRRALRTRPEAWPRQAWSPQALPPQAWPPLLAAGGLLALFAVLPDLVQNVVNPGERLLLPGLLILLLVLPLPPALVRALGLGALVLAASLTLLLATPHDWQTPVHYTALKPETAGLFRHRPTAFACKWQAMLDSAATGAVPGQPISFRTSLLIGRTYAGCTGQPG